MKLRARRLTALLLLGMLFAGSGCGRRTEEQRRLRAEVQQALAAQQFPAAIVLARRDLEQARQDNEAWENLVRAQLGAGEIKDARQALVDWRSTVREPTRTLDELSGDVALREGDPARAVEDWTRLLADEPANQRLLEKLATAYRAERRWAEAEATWTRVLALQENGAAFMQRALCRRQLHRWPEALADVRRAQSLAPEDPEVQRGARLFARLGKFLGEIRELDARLALSPEDDQTLTDRALLFLRSRDPEMALSDSRLAEKKAPWAMRPKLFQALALIELNRAAEAEALGVEKNLRLARLTPEFLQTISRLDSEISVERNNPELLVSRSWHLNDLGQPRLALQDADEALRHAPDLANALAERGFALAKLSRTEEALAALQRATEADPELAVAWQYRGELQLAKGDWADAADSLSRALTLKPNYAALEKREQAYRRLGWTEKADEDLHALQAATTR